jgi:hypothetical protein
MKEIWWVNDHEVWTKMPFAEANRYFDLYSTVGENYYPIVEQCWAIRERLAESPAKA